MNTPATSRSPIKLPRLSIPRTVTGWLITINVAIYLVDNILAAFGIGFLVGQYPRQVGDQVVMKDYTIGWAHYWLHFSATTAIQNLQVWRFIGFQFIHANIVHLLFNMFMLYMFGRIVEMFLGARRYTGFYLLCGIAGPIGYCGLWAAGWLVSHPVTPLVGASAGVFGVLIAVTIMAPDAQVLVFGLFPAKLREVSFILIFVAVYAVIFWGHSDRGNAGGEAAHLGGAAAGYLLFKHRKLLNIFGRPLATGR